jgi:hypothetical protein
MCEVRTLVDGSAERHCLKSNQCLLSSACRQRMPFGLVLVSAVFLAGEAAATLSGAVAGPFLAQAAQYLGVARAASFVTLTAAALTFLTVPKMFAIIPAQRSAPEADY